MKSLVERCQEIIADQVSLPVGQLQVDKAWIDNGLDSLDVLELIMRIEDEFNVEITDDEAETLTTVEEVAAYLKDVKHIE